MALKVAIVGRPNVGKSTLFNRLVGKRLALVDDRPGVTRDRRYADGNIGDMDLTLIDTAGYEDVTDDSLESRMREQTEAALEDGDLILFMMDAREGVTSLDQIFAERLRRQHKPVILLANKSESRESGGGIGEAYSLGFGEPVAISAEHGEGMADLYAAVVAASVDIFVEEVDEPDKPIRIAIIGRPNAGKSTLINRLIGEDRMLTGPEAGITRDSISVDWEYEGQNIRLVDTAGMRRKARVQEKLEKLSVADTIRAITFAEVVVLVMDKDDAFDTQDLQLADLVEREGRALVYVAAKWDLEESPQARLAKLTQMADDKLPQLKGSPFVALSSHSGRGVERLMPAVLQAHATWSVKVKTKDLNTWLALATQRHPPPAVDGKRIKPKYMAQTKARPPTFVLMASRAESMPEQYKRYLVNNLRESFDLPGTPIRLLVKSGSENPYAPGGSKSGPERYKGDAKTAPRKVIKKAERAEMLSNLPGKALEQKKAGKTKLKPLAGLKASANKKAGSSVAVQKGARGGARQVSRSGRVRTGQKHAPKK
ncbi:MAG: ribosome biogenesis GTPase Der [Alphaproteobacteria bacterium]|jgi:GTPase|nr:ribosome biogenesis GTPase Der [Alphaproteobacteria bacterium]MBU2042656.1 ribosome biogenesis GTPase Der [Alphaproteobacteria bacterium]MBU2124686.1 ribosome biogenesis GTPase Der [Alphaproteobacteria bacterium]MBU2207505.1 ribosome biogenesis GTPase Der [Alphaproteobacteria bacterium]MBU2291162.1 ribosome biogenesis GTPase Der [Alphaproteobacteria bacterium]